MSGTIHLGREGAHVALLEIDNPPRNTLGTAMRAKLRDELARLGADHSVRAVVVSGRGKAFCSGDDLREELAAVAGGGAPGANLLDFGRLLDEVESFRAPVIAAINGWCVGGGVELALCCDVRLASTEARFVCAGVNVGLTASAYRLPRLIGVANAKHMLFTGLPYDAETAARFGLVERAASPGRAAPRGAAARRADRVARPVVGRGDQAARRQRSRSDAAGSARGAGHGARDADRHRRSPRRGDGVPGETHPGLHAPLAAPERGRAGRCRGSRGGRFARRRRVRRSPAAARGRRRFVGEVTSGARCGRSA